MKNLILILVFGGLFLSCSEKKEQTNIKYIYQYDSIRKLQKRIMIHNGDTSVTYMINDTATVFIEFEPMEDDSNYYAFFSTKYMADTNVTAHIHYLENSIHKTKKCNYIIKDSIIYVKIPKPIVIMSVDLHCKIYKKN